MQAEKAVVVSGIRPTGVLHLGNYFGAVHHFLQMQETYDCYFFIADWHALTTHPDVGLLAQSVREGLALYLAAGLDPEKATIYVQSDVREMAELYLYLSTLAYVGELEKTPTFKEKVRLQPQNVNAGLLTYPVLMAADILIHRARYVPVGKDQAQHLEMARQLAQRFNHRYFEAFPLPQAFSCGATLIKIGALDGSGKMSKSEHTNSTIYLTDTEAVIYKKVMKARTDEGPKHPHTPMPDYIANLFQLLELSAAAEVYAHFLQAYQDCSIRYGDLKKELAQALITFLKPVREKSAMYRADEPALAEIRQKGAEKARCSARKTLALLRQRMRFH